MVVLMKNFEKKRDSLIRLKESEVKVLNEKWWVSIYPYYYTIACYSCGYRFYLLSLVEYSSVYYDFGRCWGFQYASFSIYILFEKIYRSLK